MRSGNLDAVLALGENGQPVYASALQIRETLRLRRQGALADCLAIPQANDRGDRLDWYAPFSGRMKSWLAASDHERRAALQHLTACQQDMQALSTRARAAENPAMRLFGALLSKSLQFPDQQYVYLVDGKPVITFWGFVDAQARSRDDALACLRDTLEESLPPLLVEPPPAPVAEPVSIEPVPAEPLPVEPEPEAEPVIVPAAPAAVTPAAPAAAGRFRVWMIVPPLAIAAAVVVAVLLHRPQPVSIPAAPSATLAAVPAVRPPAVVNAAEKLAATLPQKPATVNAAAAAPAAASATLASVVTPAVPARPDDLIVTPDAVRDGQVEVIDGRWRVTLGSMPTATGKPAVMHFQFKNGKGSVQIVQDHTRCKADVSAAMTSAGNLVIESRYTAKCENKSRYRMPLLICHASIGAAVCEAQYADDRVFPMTIKRESK
nr:SrfA family protein [Pantoea brenneri]